MQEWKISAAHVIVGGLAFATLWVLLTTDNTQTYLRISAVSLLSIALFATRLLPEIVTAIGCFLAFIALAVVPNDVIFSGFSSGGFWLMFSGLIIGTAISTTGLGMQIALRIFQRTGDSYVKAALLLILSGMGLGLLIPSTLPRIIIMMPIAVSLSKTMGYATDSRGHIGLALSAAVATLLPTYAVLTANLPTIIQIGAVETLYGIRPSYAQYFMEQWPINAVRALTLIVLMVPFANSRADQASELEKPSPFTPVQIRLLLLLAFAIALWATDGLHGISPAWIALTLAGVLLVPAFNILEPSAMKTKIDMSPLFFLAAVFAISAVAQHSGLAQTVADSIIPYLHLGQGGGLRDLYAITGMSALLSHLTTAPAAPAILAPLASTTANFTGWSIEAVSMSQIIGIATPLLPYQAPPLIIAMVMAQIPAAALTRVCCILAFSGAAIGLPVTYIWWAYLGVFG